MDEEEVRLQRLAIKITLCVGGVFALGVAPVGSSNVIASQWLAQTVPCVAPTIVMPNVVTPTVVAPTVVTPADVAPTVVTPSDVAPTVVSPIVVSPTVVAPNVVSPSIVTPCPAIEV